MTTVQEDALIDHILNGLRTMDLGDIKYFASLDKIIHNGEIKPIAIFILCSCFIDHMAQLRFFKKGLGMGERYRKFVGHYLGSHYQPRKLYDSLRSRLVHNYSVRGRYYLDWNDETRHLKAFVDSEGRSRVWLNLNVFISDLEVAFASFTKDLKQEPEARKSALNHQLSYELLKSENVK
jgi:hypothetical protein